MLKTDLLSVFMHTQFCQGHRVHTVAALTMSKLQERQPLPEASSACAVFPSFIALMLSVKSSAYLLFRLPGGMRGEALGISRHRASGNMGLKGCGWFSPEQSALLFLPPPRPAPTRELPSHILRTQQRTWTGKPTLAPWKAMKHVLQRS